MSDNHNDTYANDNLPLTEAIDSLFRQAAARDELNRVLEGKTADERRDILILMLCRSVGQLAQQHDALSALLGKAIAIIEAQDRRIIEAELKNVTLEMRVIALEKKAANVRGPFIQRILNRNE